MSGEGAAPASRVESALADVERALQLARRRTRAIRREMASGADPAQARHRGDLLLARLHQVERGTTQVTLLDFDGREVTLALDPAKAPHENAEALYEEASRLERARDKLPRLLNQAQASVTELLDLRGGLLDGRVSPQTAEAMLSQRLDSAATSGARPDKASEAQRQPFRRFRSSGGLEIRVGRGPRDNDALTFHRSNPEDIWLHARGAGAAHVILRWSRADQPPVRDLTEAAVLAALHSSARGAGVVPVDWTRRKYVRKPRKAPPGAVVAERVRTLFVEPDADLPARLAWSP